MRGVVERLDFDGMGILRKGRREIRVPFTAPGDVVEVVKWRRKKRKLIALDFRIIEPSPERTEPLCPHFGTCGGCLLQHLPYEKQLEFKAEKLSALLGMDVEVRPSPRVYGHRNRIDVVISTNGIGFRRRGTWWDVVDIEMCPVFGETSARVLRSLREFIEDHKPSLYKIGKNEGFLRYIVMREGKFTGELMINLITSEGDLPESFPEYFDYATSIYWSVNRTKSDVSQGDVERFWKSEFIRERLGDVTYLIHPNSFFQTNSHAAVLLLEEVSKRVEGERVLDLYSGVGTFGVWLARRGFKVEGIELNPFAVEMANKNAEINGVNAKFRVGRAEGTSVGDYDTVIVDPPRKGLKEAAELLVKSGVEKIVYVSCNPKAFKLDYERHLKKAYRIDGAVLIDMFPHTPHVEAVMELVRRD